MTDLESIGDMFAELACHDLASIPLLLDHGSRLLALREEEASDPVWRAWISRGREAKRAAKIEADAAYAAKRKRQTRAAYERRKARLAREKKAARKSARVKAEVL
jgi:hypothetical protein